jgi:hypothetical protein
MRVDVHPVELHYNSEAKIGVINKAHRTLLQIEDPHSRGYSHETARHAPRAHAGTLRRQLSPHAVHEARQHNIRSSADNDDDVVAQYRMT